jgi:hypothetical protein
VNKHTSLFVTAGAVIVVVCCWRMICPPDRRPTAASEVDVAQPHAARLDYAVERLKTRLRHPDSLQVLERRQVMRGAAGETTMVELHFTARGVKGEPVCSRFWVTWEKDGTVSEDLPRTDPVYDPQTGQETYGVHDPDGVFKRD